MARGSAAGSKRRFSTLSVVRCGLGLSLTTLFAFPSLSVADPDSGLAPNNATVEFSFDPLGTHVIKTKEPEWQSLPYGFTFGQGADITENPSQKQAPKEDTNTSTEYAPITHKTEKPEVFQPVIYRIGKPVGDAPVPDCTVNQPGRLIVCVDMEHPTNRVAIGDLPLIVDFSAEDHTVITSPSYNTALEVQNVIISHGRAQKNGWEIHVADIPGCTSDCEKKAELSRLELEGVEVSHAK